MPGYEKWLGAGVGFVAGGPLGSLLGYVAGGLFGTPKQKADSLSITELEATLMVLASHLIKTEGKVSLHQIEFIRKFLKAYFPAGDLAAKIQMLHHCLQKEYDLGTACDQLRIYTTKETRQQIVRFMIDLAESDGALTVRQDYFISKVARYININDVEFKRIKAHQDIIEVNAYVVLGVNADSTAAQIRTRYRKLVLELHPDRNTHLSVAELKKLAAKLQQIREAYAQIKAGQGL